MSERDRPSIRWPCGVALVFLWVSDLGELPNLPAREVDEPEPGSSVALPAKDHAPAVRRDRGIEVLRGVAYRIRYRPRRAAAGGQRPQLPEQVEDDRAVGRREVEGQLGPLASVDRNGFRGLMSIRCRACGEQHQRQTRDESHRGLEEEFWSVIVSTDLNSRNTSL